MARSFEPHGGCVDHRTGRNEPDRRECVRTVTSDEGAGWSATAGTAFATLGRLLKALDAAMEL